MRKLIIVRGLPGSGKSTLVHNIGLKYNHLSGDQIRLAFSGLRLNLAGQFTINQDHNQRVWGILRESYQLRLKDGETFALEGKFEKLSDLKIFINEALLEGYRIVIADLYATPLETLKERNENRAGYQRTNIIGTEKDLARASKISTADWIVENYPDAGIIVDDQIDGLMNKRLRAFLDEPVIDLSHFRKIVHIGDLQGVHQALHGDWTDGEGHIQPSPVQPQLEDDVAYVFVGDALDRGIENGTLMRWIIEEVTPRLGRNVWWVRGNHEIHLEYWAKGRQPFSREFNTRTLPQLVDEGITPDMIKPFVAGMVEYLIYTWHGQHVIALHGGLPAFTWAHHLISSEQLMKGPGFHSTQIDAMFDDWANRQRQETGEIWTQVHGHRNSAGIAIDAYDHSINLEGQPDAGGFIRIAVLDEHGWKTIELINHVYMDPFERQDIERAEKRQEFSPALPRPSWI